MGMINHQIEDGISLLDFFDSFKSINEDGKLIVILFLQVCWDLAVDEEGVSIVLVFNHLNHFKVLSFGDFLFLSCWRIESEIVGEGNNGGLLGDGHVCEGERLKSQNYSMMLHESVDHVEVTEIGWFNGKSSLIDLVYEVNGNLYVLLYWILRNQHGVLDLFVVKKGFFEVYISFTPFLLHLKRDIIPSKVFFWKELNHILVFINDTVYLWNSPEFGQGKKDVLWDIAAYIDYQWWMQLLYDFSGLLHVFVVKLLFICLRCLIPRIKLIFLRELILNRF
jgi:hypothetical protein